MTEIVSFDGVKIYFEVIGDGDVSLLLICGWGTTTGREHWHFQLPLSSKYKLILIDLPGHGKSGKNRENFTMQSYAQDVKSVVEYLNLNNVILVGHSMGGIVDVETELLISERILGLIAVDSLFPTIGSVYRKIDGSNLEKAVQPFKDNFEQSYKFLLMSFWAENLDKSVLQVFIDAIPTLDQRSLISAWTEMCKWEMMDILPKVQKPIKCIVAGRTTQNYSKEEYDQTFEDTIYLDGLGHLLPIEEPERFNTALEAQIQKLLIP